MILKGNKKISITRHLLVMVLAISTTITTILTGIQFALEYHHRNNELLLLIEGVRSGVVPGLETHLWQMDVAAAAVQLKSMLGSLDVSSIKMITPAGDILFDEQKPNFTPKYPIKTVMEVRATHRDTSNTLLATVEFTFYRDKLLNELFDHVMVVLALNGLKTLLVASILAWVFYRRLADPLIKMTAYYRKNREPSFTDPEELVKVAKSRQDDELQELLTYLVKREDLVREWAKEQETKLSDTEQKLATTGHQLELEKARAETSARLAQLGEMASSIAHEINNPLAIISGYSFIILRELKKEPPNLVRIDDTIRQIERTTSRITKIITGLRAYARDGSQDPMEAVPLQSLLDDALSLTETRLKAKGIMLKVMSHHPPDSAVNCRSVQIVQVLVAILNNAIDAVKDLSDPWIELQTDVLNKNAKITITDAGTGIPQDVAKRLFEPFFTTKPVGVGTGLGLSIAHGIIADHNGSISLDHSAKNTRFVIEIPATACEDQHRSVS